MVEFEIIRRKPAPGQPENSWQPILHIMVTDDYGNKKELPVHKDIFDFYSTMKDSDLIGFLQRSIHHD